MIKKIILIILLLVQLIQAKSQINNYDFSQKKKFGFCTGLNITFLKLKNNSVYTEDTILNVSNSARPGVNIGLTYKWLYKKHISLYNNFAISFSTSQINYLMLEDGVQTKIDFFTDFVIVGIETNIKYNSMRYNNLRTNFIFGVCPSIYIKGSGQYYTNIVDGTMNAYVMNYKKTDLIFNLGTGMDILGINNLHCFELLFSGGINNLLIRDKSDFTKKLDYIYLRSITLRYIFN